MKIQVAASAKTLNTSAAGVGLKQLHKRLA
jgi:hypothetical protein